MKGIKKPVRLGLGLVVFGFYIAAALPAAAAKNKTEMSTASGTAVSANFDFEHADLSTPAFYLHGEGKGNGGKFSYQAVVEVAPDGNHCTVPGGAANAGTEFALVGRSAVLRYTASGDLLFTKANSATLCADFSSSTPPYTAHIDGDIIGGTGKFAQATGTFSSTEKGAFLSFDAGKRAFGWFQSDIVTTLSVP